MVFTKLMRRVDVVAVESLPPKSDSVALHYVIRNYALPLRIEVTTSTHQLHSISFKLVNHSR